MSCLTRYNIMINLKALTVDTVNKIFIRRNYLNIIGDKRDGYNLKAIVAYVLTARNKRVAKRGISRLKLLLVFSVYGR